MMKVTTLLLAVVCIGTGLIIGCGGDDGGPNPVTGVAITPDKASLEIGHSTGITAIVTGGDSENLTWFVNGIENGNAVYGTIAQNSPVTYNAPDSLPSPRTVVIGAVPAEDTSKVDTCRIRIEFTRIFVDSATGDDATANGCINIPYRTITMALGEATSGMTVLVRPGTYSDTAGESFPIQVPEEISLVGENWETCIIRKETTEFDGSEGINVSGDDATVRKLTIRDAAPLGNTRFYASVYTSRTNTLIDSVRIFERGRMACIRIDRAIDAIVQNCVLDVGSDIADAKITGRGFEIVFNDQGTVVRNCRISGFHSAIFFNSFSDALVEGCVLENCDYGGEICCYNSSTSNPNPDFGGGARGSAGGNLFRSYSECGLLNQGTSTVYAKYNTWHNDPPVAGEDYCIIGDGSIVVE